MTPEEKAELKKNYVPAPGCDNPFEERELSPEELEKLLWWWEGNEPIGKSKGSFGSFGRFRYTKNESGQWEAAD